jgi:hypothetical protein
VRNSRRGEQAFKEDKAMGICCWRALTDVSVSPHWNGVQSAGHVLNGTAPIARPAQTEVVSIETKPESLSNVKPGDVLVSRSTAVREHEISVVPNAPHALSATHDAAVSDGRSGADALGVDAWLTEDHTHVVKIASHRAPDK